MAKHTFQNRSPVYHWRQNGAKKIQTDTLLPDVPVVAEVVPGFEVPPAWTALFGPANLPQGVLRRIHSDTVKAVTSPEGRAKILDVGFEPMASKSPEEFAAQVKRQIALVERIVKAAGIPPVD
jgi:tripartite-type tricarboxylate transporter receptor subunit TctC